jgi:hypothetical protein
MASHVKIPQCLYKGKVMKTRLESFSVRFLKILQDFFRLFQDMLLVDTVAIDDGAVSMLTELTTGPGVHLVHPFFRCPLVLSQPP